MGSLMILAYFFGPAGPDKTIVNAPVEQFATAIRGTGEGLSEMAGRIGGVIGISGYGLLKFRTPRIHQISSTSYLQKNRETRMNTRFLL